MVRRHKIDPTNYAASAIAVLPTSESLEVAPAEPRPPAHLRRSRGKRNFPKQLLCTHRSLIDRADSCIALPAAVTDCLPPAVSQCGRATSTPVDIYARLSSTSSRGGWSMRNSALVADCRRSDLIQVSVISLRVYEERSFKRHYSLRGEHREMWTIETHLSYTLLKENARVH